MTDKNLIYQAHAQFDKKNTKVSMNKLQIVWVDNSQKEKCRQLTYMGFQSHLGSKSKNLHSIFFFAYPISNNFFKSAQFYLIPR